MTMNDGDTQGPPPTSQLQTSATSAAMSPILLHTFSAPPGVRTMTQHSGPLSHIITQPKVPAHVT